MINKVRRSLLKASASGTAISAMMACGLIVPKISLGKSFSNAFGYHSMDEVLNELFETTSTIPSDAVTIVAPDIAENGTVVPVTVRTKLPNIQSITIIAEKNPYPLAASFEMSNKMAGHIATRIKLGKTQDVWAVVYADGKLFTAKKEVKVTVGGCGG
ncbi:thiosulfate oxidation carrier protein SoxY [Sedimenticola selenatireducens]|uniref:thiosulfate oxidation carrier protein SoxY n=1 Tax=Sedimenticola selenatireducens TaxID=191960 RepID=UPI000566EA76|nr:thiosulfate oxidation carrier protein SoxY [Sedimenticola selenatireducens]